MRKYTVKIAENAEKFVDKNFSKGDKNKFLSIILDLEKCPFNTPYKKVKNEKNTYRFRIRDFRIFFSVSGNTVSIRFVGHRRNIYKKKA